MTTTPLQTPAVRVNGRALLGTLLAAVLAAAVLWLFADLYLWSKFQRLPAWMSAWAPPMFLGGAAVFFALVPAAVFPATTAGAANAVVGACVLAPLPVAALYAMSYTGDYAGTNTLAQYFWVMLTACAIPATVLIALRVVAGWFDRFQPTIRR